MTRALNVPDRKAKFREFNEQTGKRPDVLELIVVAEQSVHLLTSTYACSRSDSGSPNTSVQRSPMRVRRWSPSMISTRSWSRRCWPRSSGAVASSRWGIDRVLSKKGLDEHATVFYGVIQRLRHLPPGQHRRKN